MAPNANPKALLSDMKVNLVALEQEASRAEEYARVLQRKAAAFASLISELEGAGLGKNAPIAPGPIYNTEGLLPASSGTDTKRPVSLEKKHVGGPHAQDASESALMRQMAHEIIRAAGKPMKAKDIVAAILSTGYQPKSSDLTDLVKKAFAHAPILKVGRALYSVSDIEEAKD